jgi:pantothenate kinase type III
MILAVDAGNTHIVLRCIADDDLLLKGSWILFRKNVK